MSDYQTIQRAIDAAVRANKGKAFIASATVSNLYAVRTALEALANACGLPEPQEQGLSSDQLAMIYAVARKDMGKACGIASDWQSKGATIAPSGFNPLLDTPAPPAPPSAAPFDLEAVLEAARKEASAMADYIARDRLSGIEQHLNAIVLERVQERVRAAIAALAPTQLQVTLPDAPSVALGLVHYAQESVITLLAAGLNVYLYGPAGSGKTTAGKLCAKAFGLPFYFTGKIDSEYLLLGFVDARGETIRTQFREAYEHGGVFLFDEVDRSAPSAFTALNAALANGFCAFPDGIVYANADFKCIAAGNTPMTGADNTYTAGQQQDASSIDRFAFEYWGYDERLELALASCKDWARYVQAVRAEVSDRGLSTSSFLVTPRATLDGCKLIAAGKPWSYVADRVLWKGLDRDTVAQLELAVSQFRADQREAA